MVKILPALVTGSALASAAIFALIPVSPVAAQILLCPETGLPISQPGCPSQNSSNNEPSPPPPRRIPPGMDPANLPPSNIPAGYYWGSVAIASNQQLYTAYARPDRSTAEREALSQCQNATSAGCAIVATVNIRDLALVTDGNSMFSADAIGPEKALGAALKKCRKASGECRTSMVFSPLSGPWSADVVNVMFGGQ